MFKFSLRSPLQLNPHLTFLWGRMDMNAKLRNIKLEFHCILYVWCMFGNSNPGCHLVFVGAFQPLK
jgi:hypothetical protein